MNGVQVASLFGVIDLVDNLSPGLNNADRNLTSFGQRLTGLGDTVSGVGLRLTALTAPVNAAIAAGIATASSFQDAMAEISARTGLVGAELQQISDYALQMGADTAFSAQQAADAFLQLLSSGQTAEEAIATLPAVLDAAAASGEDLGRTADTVTDIMAAFGLGVEDAGDVVDYLARAAGASSADMASLGEGFNNVGGVARQFGISVEETAAILAIFAENGIKGANAGTQLRSMLLNMSRNTEDVQGMWEQLGTSLYDAQGNMRPLAAVLEDIERATASMTDEEKQIALTTLAGSYGILGLNALTSGMDMEIMLNRMDESASAADIAAARMNTFSGRIDTLKGSVETLMIKALTPLMENTLTPLAEVATELVGRITDWTDANPELTTQLAAMSLAVGVLAAAMVPVGAAVAAITFSFSAIAAPITIAVLAIGALAAAFATDFLGIRTTVTNAVNDVQTKLSWLWYQFRQGTPQDALNFIVRSVEDMFNRAAAYPYDVAAEYLWLQVRGALHKAGIRLPILDVSAIQDDITSALSTLQLPETNLDLTQLRSDIEGGLAGLDFSNVQGIFETHFDTIVNLIAVAAGIVFGGPVGLIIGAGKLVASAIENDFLGIGTFLSESGISSTVESAFNDLRTRIENLVSTTFSGDVKLPQIQIFGRSLEDLVNGALSWFSDIGTGAIADITAGLSDLGDGIGGFITNLSGAETEGLDEVVTVIVGAIGGIIGLAVKIGGNLIGGALSGIGKALPDIGSAIADFITTISRIGEGDWGGALESLGSGVSNLHNAVSNVTAGFMDGVIGALNDLFGLNIPNWETLLSDFTTSIETMMQAFMIIGDKIGRWFDITLLDIRLRMTNGLALVRQDILNATGFDIAPNINVDLSNLALQSRDFHLADELERVLGAQLSNQSINLDEMIAVTVNGETLYTPLREALSDPYVLNSLSMTGKDRVEDVLRFAYLHGGDELANLIIPAALNLGIDVDGVIAQVDESITAAADAQVYPASPAVDMALQPDMVSIVDQYIAFIEQGGDAQTFLSTPEVSMTLGTTLSNITSQIANFVTSGAAARVFQVSSTADVTVSSGSINTSPLASAVQSAIRGALNMATSIAQALGFLRDSGGPGVAGQPYVITPKAGPEVFIPSTNGYFIPNFDKFMAGAGGNAGGGVTVNGGVHINVPESAMVSPQAARAAGDEFGRAFMERVREMR